MLNKQQPFGADVISRISATMLDPTALERLRDLARETLQELADEVCEAGRRRPGRGVRGGARRQRDDDRARARDRPGAARRGAVHHVAARRYPDDAGVGARARACTRRARATVFPALGAYVGGDIVAGLLATGMTRDTRLRLFIDVGTNCEIALGSAERLLCTAAPAGPAFEAAQIRCGMRAADGAIEVVRIRDDELELDVIGDVEPRRPLRLGPRRRVRRARARRAARRLGPASSRTRRRPSLARASPAPWSAPGEDERVFVLHWERRGGRRRRAVYLSQRDVRELQFAKAAIATGWRLLVEELGIERGRDPAGAARRLVRLVPLARERDPHRPRAEARPARGSSSAGNVAGEGAKMALLSLQERHAATAMLEQVEYVELSDRPDFNDRFVDQLAFPA